MYKVDGVKTLTLIRTVQTGVFNDDWRPSNTVFFSGKHMFYFEYEGEKESKSIACKLIQLNLEENPLKPETKQTFNQNKKEGENF